ncbi:MAG: glycoside hydrolase family 36 protein [Saccharofermentanales bacterium]
MGYIYISENGLNLVFDLNENGEIKLVHFSPSDFIPGKITKHAEQIFTPAEVQISGEKHSEYHGCKHNGSSFGKNLIYKSHDDSRNLYGRKIELHLTQRDISIICHYQFYDNIKCVRSWTEVRNESVDTITLEYVSSFCLKGFDKNGLKHWVDKSLVYIPHNTTCGEVQWKTYGIDEAGLYSSNPSQSLKRISISNTSTWGSNEHLPMGCYFNKEASEAILWQIENNGSWNWELSDVNGYLYLLLSGPSEQENFWSRNLESGESFESVKTCVCFDTSFESAMQEMTKYRRKIRRTNDDNINLPVIFNDYMNCISADPTTEKLLPLVDIAADLGCECFCIDAGWYSEGYWWDFVGEWIPSAVRFPKGIQEVTEYIIKKNMIAGIWIEPMVMGINCPIAENLPDEWFFVRHSKKVIDNGRYQLDFRNPEVIEYANKFISRLVNEFKVGYIKIDYNINGGMGTEINSDSFGDGLLGHGRAYLKWIDDLFETYPGLIIENCGSGGQTMDYSLLARHSIQSVTDQTDYVKMAVIAAACATAATPEQAAIWSYPGADANDEETAFNMINTMLLRIHQSGPIDIISEKNRNMIKEAIMIYKSYRKEIPACLPFWPTGLTSFTDDWVSFGLKGENRIFIAAWRIKGKDTYELKLPSDIKVKEIKIIYPTGLSSEYYYDWNENRITVRIPASPAARLFEITIDKSSDRPPFG